MLTISKKTSQGRALALFYLAIFAAAVIRDVVLAPYVAHPLGATYGAFVEPLWKLATWMIPCYLYIRYVLHGDVLQYLKFTAHVRRGVLWGILGSAALFAYFFLPGLVLRVSVLHVNLSFDDWLNGVALVGFMEEIPFRGVMLQQLMEWMSFWKASTLTTVLFVFIHVPLWISTDVHPFPDMLFNALQVGLVSFVLCYVFRKSESLWSSIIVHTVYDLFSLLY